MAVASVLTCFHCKKCNRFTTYLLLPNQAAKALYLHQQSSNCTDDEESIPSLLGDSDDDDNDDDLNIDLQSSPAPIGPYMATNALSNIADQNCGHQTGSTSADCLPLQLSIFFDEAMTSRTRTFLPILQCVFVDHVPIVLGYFIGDKE